MTTDDSPPTWDDFMAQVARIAPGSSYDAESRFEDMPVFERLAITRWLSDLLARPADVDILRQHGTLGAAWDWFETERDQGQPLRSRDGATPLGATTRINLRPVLPEQDIVPLYMAAFDPAKAAMWRYRGRSMPIDRFAATLFDGVLAQFMVVMADSGVTVGLVTAYDENPWGLHCKVGFLRCGDRFPGDAGAMFEGVIAFITYLFKTFPYRKVFAEVPSYNMSLYSEGFAQEEGVLRDYLFFDGRFVDMHVVSFTREIWDSFSEVTGW